VGEAKKVAALFAEIKVLRIFVSYNKQHNDMCYPIYESPSVNVNDAVDSLLTVLNSMGDCETEIFEVSPVSGSAGVIVTNTQLTLNDLEAACSNVPGVVHFSVFREEGISQAYIYV